MTLEEYIKQNYPEILKEYTRATQGKEILKRGMWVTTLQAGFGGPAGRHCQFIKEVKPGDITKDGHKWGDHYLLFGYLGEDGEEDIRWALEPDRWAHKIEICEEQ